MQIEFVKILSRYWPDRECYSLGPNYSDIVWTDGLTPVTEAALNAKHLDHVKWEAEEAIKKEAFQKRDEVYAIVLNSDDPAIARLYEEKEKQARYYKEKIDASETPDPNRILLLTQESTGLGMTEEQLADAIIAQADAAYAQIFPMLGQIEGIRRAKQYMVSIAATDTEVETLMATPITWPDFSTLVRI